MWLVYAAAFVVAWAALALIIGVGVGKALKYLGRYDEAA